MKTAKNSVAVSATDNVAIKLKTAAAYARYSTDKQKDSSIDDQFTECERIAARHGLKIVARFADRAKSSAGMYDREEMLALVRQLRNGKFEALICEAEDRLSRNPSDLHYIWDMLTFGRAKLFTLSGESSKITIGVRGITGSMFMEDLTNKVRRGMNGIVEKGLVGGRPVYGYRRVLGEPDENGLIGYKPGVREVDAVESKIVLRVFTEYANGASPGAIAAGLARDGIPTPRGARAWGKSMLISGRSAGVASGRLGGLLGNPIYIGKIYWNVHSTMKDPETERRVRRPADPELLKIVEAPHLRIIPQDLWDAVQAIRKERSVEKFGETCTVRPMLPRKQRLFSGLLRCGACNGGMRFTGGGGRKDTTRVACSSAHQHRTCDHTKTYDLMMIKAAIIDNLPSLADPEYLAEYQRAYTEEQTKLTKRNTADGDIQTSRRELESTQVKIDRLAIAIRDAEDDVSDLVPLLKPLTRKRDALRDRIKLLEANKGVVLFHPKALTGFGVTVTRLVEALETMTDEAEVQDVLRNTFECFIVKPTMKRQRYKIQAVLRASAVTGHRRVFAKVQSMDKTLAAEPLSYSDIVENRNVCSPVSDHEKGLISLPFWTAKAG